MHLFNSKELYMMNGGNKIYIHKDGFGDVYTATPEEEQVWAQEVIGNAIETIRTQKDAVTLQTAINNLLFHHYAGLQDLLEELLATAIPEKQVALATALWKHFQYSKSFDLICSILVEHRAACLDSVFSGLIEFKQNRSARLFLINCLLGDDELFFTKANTTIGMWAYTGLPELRQGKLLSILADKYHPEFQSAITRLREILAVA